MAELSDRWPRPDRPPTREEKVSCVKREIYQRKRVYERRISTGAMTSAAAGKELWLMQAILQDYENSTAGRLL